MFDRQRSLNSMMYHFPVQLHGVSYTAELQLCGVSYTREFIVKPLKTTTTLKTAFLKKNRPEGQN